MSLLVGASGFSFASWRPGFYPAGRARRTSCAYYAGVLRDGRGQLELLPPARPPRRSSAGRPPCPTAFASRSRCRARSRSSGASTTCPPSASACARWAIASGRCSCAPPTTASATTTSCARCSTASTTTCGAAFDLRDPSWDGVEALLEGRDAVRVNQLDAPAPFRYLRLREPPYDDAALAAWARAAAPAARRRPRGALLLHARGRADGAGLCAAVAGAGRGLTAQRACPGLWRRRRPCVDREVRRRRTSSPTSVRATRRCEAATARRPVLTASR